MTTIRAFIDSSVLMAASISATGSARELIDKGFGTAVQLFVSELVLEETERNLTAKAPSGLPYLRIFLATSPAQLVNPSKELVLEGAGVVAVKDAPIVAAAAMARVEYLVSFDRKHLLVKKEEIKAEFGIMAVTPDEVLGGLRGKQNQGSDKAG